MQIAIDLAGMVLAGILVWLLLVQAAADLRQSTGIWIARMAAILVLAVVIILLAANLLIGERMKELVP